MQHLLFINQLTQTNVKPYLLLVNPASGAVAKLKIIDRVCHSLTHAGIDYDIVFTQRPGHATELAAAAAAEGRHAVLACGGDGTVNETASGLIGTDTALGIIPTGSGNGLARHLGIPVDIRRSIDVIAEDNIIAADYGTANGHPFFCTFGVGFDAAVSERCARERRRGVMMYLRNAISEYFKFRPEEYTIEIDGRTITEKAFLVVCCNASQYGNNAFIAPQASVTDGVLDMIVVHANNLITQSILGIDMITGLVRDNAAVSTFKASSVRIVRHEKGAAHADGDAMTMPEVIDIVCHPGKLKVLSPSKKTVFKPIVTPTALFFRDLGLAVCNIFPIRLPKKS